MRYFKSVYIYFCTGQWLHENLLHLLTQNLLSFQNFVILIFCVNLLNTNYNFKSSEIL